MPLCGEFGKCVACEKSAECEDLGRSVPYCAESGRCEECITDKQCSTATPVCDDGQCRACQEHSECESLACSPEGTCVNEEHIIYQEVLGSLEADCGTRKSPCHNPQHAAKQLTAVRSYFVVLPADKPIAGTITIPDDLEAVTIIGNDVSWIPSGGDTAIRIGKRSNVTLHGIRVSGVDFLEGAIFCDRAELHVQSCFFSGNTIAVSSRDCDVEVEDSTFELQTNYALDFGCWIELESCQEYKVERSLFENNRAVISARGDTLFRNNVVVGNGDDQGTAPLISFLGGAREFTFNTLYSNTNDCEGSGIVSCGDLLEQVSANNITLNNYPAKDCPQQVYSGCEGNRRTISYSLAETVWSSGVSNSTEDPRLTDPANGDFEPEVNSPAVDAGDPLLAPEVDFFGHPRIVGSGPDIGAVERQ